LEAPKSQKNVTAKPHGVNAIKLSTKLEAISRPQIALS